MRNSSRSSCSSSSGSKVLNLALRGNNMNGDDGFLMTRNTSRHNGAPVDPFWEVADSEHQRIAQSTTIAKSKKPHQLSAIATATSNWPKVSIPLKDLCDGDLDETIYFSFYDYQKDGRHIFMGSFPTTVKTLLKAADTWTFNFKLIVDHANYGNITVSSAEILHLEQRDQNDTTNTPLSNNDFINTDQAVIINKTGEKLPFKPDMLKELAPPPPPPQQKFGHIHEPSPGIGRGNVKHLQDRKANERMASEGASYWPSMPSLLFGSVSNTNTNTKTNTNAHKKEPSSIRIKYVSGLRFGYSTGLPSGI